MNIRSLYIDRLFNEYSYSLELCDRLTFLHSPNGYGKSTLMGLLNCALRGDVGHIADVPFQRMDIGFEDDTAMIIENDEGDLLVQMQKNELESPMTPEEMAEIRSVTYIPPERLVVRRKDGHLVSAIEVYGHELMERIRYAREHTELVPQPMEGRREMNDGELEFWAKDLKAKLDFIGDAGFEPDIPPGMRFPPSRYELTTRREEYVELIYSISEFVERDYGLAESIVVFRDIVNEIFINKTITVSENGKMGIQMDNGTALQITRLSSGERQILIMFYILLFHAQPGSLVILDEPEISLHVSWQQRLGDFFMDICRVRDLQMIVATHSPQVIHDKWDLARELVPEDA